MTGLERLQTHMDKNREQLFAVELAGIQYKNRQFCYIWPWGQCSKDKYKEFTTYISMRTVEDVLVDNINSYSR